MSTSALLEASSLDDCGTRDRGRLNMGSSKNPVAVSKPTFSRHEDQAGTSSPMALALRCRESNLFELPVKFRPLNLPVAKGPLQLDGSLPSLNGLGEFPEIGGLSQVESDEFVNQTLDLRGARGMAHGNSRKGKSES